MTKPPFLLLLVAAVGFAQSFRFGVEGISQLTKGITAGAGLEFRHLVAGAFGEIRYTHWSANAFSAPNGGLNSTRNQADLLVGVTF